MDQSKITHFKKRLEEERVSVEAELQDLGWKNPQTGEWEATERELETMSPLADSNEAADKLEEYDEHRAEIEPIEMHWMNIKRALGKIDEGTYGTCEISGEIIEEDRLEANPSARTCKAHMNEEKNLPA